MQLLPLQTWSSVSGKINIGTTKAKNTDKNIFSTFIG
jgi:hypothetical protein